MGVSLDVIALFVSVAALILAVIAFIISQGRGR
jgi:hypothetical protein